MAMARHAQKTSSTKLSLERITILQTWLSNQNTLESAKLCHPRTQSRTWKTGSIKLPTKPNASYVDVTLPVPPHSQAQ
jgi:hypothetical protein